ncbi:DUF6603 domain-containing protein [Tateyamaria sp. SN6-1]|uniref:DUF6603 domain-containing protein n=1 Tax=Tateyamaria sp. SN6-1 TaxID=3092148 RepID=UPI0039F58471
MTQPPAFLSALRAFAEGCGDLALSGVSGIENCVGLHLPLDVQDAPDVVAAEATLAPLAEAAQALASRDAVPAGTAEMAAEIAGLAGAVSAIFAALEPMSRALIAAADTSRDLGDTAALKAEAGNLRRVFLDTVVGEVLANVAPKVRVALYVLGVLRLEDVEDDTYGYTVEKTRVDLDAARALISDPAAAVGAPLAWGQPTFDLGPLLRVIAEMAGERDYLHVRPDEDGTPLLDTGTVEVRQKDDGVLLRYADAATLTDGAYYAVGDGWRFSRSASATATGAVAVTVSPPLEVAVTADAGFETRLEMALSRDPDAGPFDLFGGPEDPLAAWITAPRFAVGLVAKDDVITPDVALEFKGLTVKLSAAEADGFLKTVLGQVELSPEFDIGAIWSPQAGLQVQASGGLETQIAINRDIGPVSLNTLDLALAVGDDAVLRLDIGAGLGLDIGPVAAVVERIGARFVVEEDDETGLTVGTRFLPPRGLGLAIDAGPAKGGGFLSFEPEKGRYAGALEIDIGEIGVSAVGLLTTKEAGFSLVVLLSGEFPAIQLGFGFTLNAVGGLVGINRTVDPDFLRDGLRAQTLDNVMFPRDPVARAPEILRDLEGAFPARRGQHVFGPMVRLGWGTPPILAAEFGLVLELDSPLRLILMGKLRAGLPTLAIDPQIAKINMDVLGIIDFDRKEATLDAVLYDSRIAIYGLEGEMAMRLRWGADPFFILSVGGTHPAFASPPDLPDLQRLALSLGAGDNPRLRLECFVAVSSNTVQFGAAIDARAAAMGFVAEARLGFDALFELSPFSFQARLFASAALKRGGTSLVSVDLSLVLRGPSPYTVSGRATARICLVPVDVPFNATFGQARRVDLPAGNPVPALVDALTDAANWQVALPENGAPHVRLAGSGAGALHPLGRLGVRQQVLPLDVTIERFGTFDPGATRHFRLHAVRLRLGGRDVALEAEDATRLTEPFAPAQFFEMSDDEKLSAPSFEPMTAGISGYGTQAVTLPFVGATPGARTGIVRDASRQTLYVTGTADAETHPVEEALMTAATVSPAVTPKRAGFGLAEPRYALATKRNLRALRARDNTDFADIPELDTPEAHRFWVVRRALDAHLRRHPGDAGRLIVVPEHELEAAA